MRRTARQRRWVFGGLSTRRRRWGAGAAAFVLVLIGLFLVLRERTWTVRIVADSLETTPGTPVTLTARVLPSTTVNSEWRWIWSSRSGVVTGTGPQIEFVSSTLGEHRVAVTAWSSRGARHTAEVTVTVVVPTYYVATGPNPTRVDRPEQDPIPDVVHYELPYRITNVTVDKPAVCRGEKATIRVEAEQDEGKADWLLPNIAGSTGWAVSIVVPATKPGRYKIPVMITDPDTAPMGKPALFQQTSAFIELKDCDLPASLGVGTQPASTRTEDVNVHARYHSAANDVPASYLWDFGDGSAKVTTGVPLTRHKYPDERDRGPGRRVFSYVIHADALDSSGKVLASGVADFSLRNSAEEDERTRHRIDLMADYSPLAKTLANGDHTLDVTIRNLSAGESAVLKSLEYQLLSCDASPTPSTETHAAGEVFSNVTIPPRGSVTGHMVWPASSPNACRIDVTVTGTSDPSGYPAYAGFSMRVQLEGSGVSVFNSPDQDEGSAMAHARTAAAIDEAMAKLNKNTLTKEDIELLVSKGEMDPSVARTLLPGKANLPPHR